MLFADGKGIRLTPRRHQQFVRPLTDKDFPPVFCADGQKDNRGVISGLKNRLPARMASSGIRMFHAGFFIGNHGRWHSGNAPEVTNF
jgi:hypothetical protein